MRPRSKENRDLPPGVYRRKRTSKSKKNPNKAWISYYYRDKDGKEIPLGADQLSSLIAPTYVVTFIIPKHR